MLYTDGLVERPGESLDIGLGRLQQIVVAQRDNSVQQIAEHLVEQLVDDSPRDDIAFVVKRIH